MLSILARPDLTPALLQSTCRRSPCGAPSGHPARENPNPHFSPNDQQDSIPYVARAPRLAASRLVSTQVRNRLRGSRSSNGPRTRGARHDEEHWRFAAMIRIAKTGATERANHGTSERGNQRTWFIQRSVGFCPLFSLLSFPSVISIEITSIRPSSEVSDFMSSCSFKIG